MLFDPSIDFAGTTAKVQQAQVLADQLRKQAALRQVPQGQMVSGHYVAPHWTQYLGGLADQGNAIWQNNIANQAATDAAQQQEAHAQEWRSSLPQAVAAQAGMAPNYVMESPEGQAGSPATPYQPVPVGTRLRHTLEGMRNPLLAKEAAMWEKGMAEETTREDTQAARRETLNTTLQQQRELRMEQLAQQERDAARRSEDTRLSIEQRREAAAQANATRAMIAQMAAAARADAAAARRDSQGAKVDRAVEAQDRKLEKLGEGSKKTAAFMLSGQQVQDMLDKYGEKSIPGIGYVGKLPGALLTNEGNLNRATVKSFVNAIMREHAGLSQTISEQTNVNLETMADGNFTEKEFRKVWPFLRDRANASMNNFRAGFAPEVITEFEKRGGVLKNITPKTTQSGWKVEEVK